ncbi:hypothetical protein [Caulifigura coniformis]|nr:hypothetical protein [Caulifigura coniformis]
MSVETSFYNDSGEIIPAYAVMMITGTHMIGTRYLQKVEKPDVDAPNAGFILNGPTKIPIGKTGTGKIPANSGWAKYDTGGAPAAGDEWGPVTGSWELGEDGTGFKVVGTGPTGMVLVRFSGTSSSNGGGDGTGACGCTNNPCLDAEDLDVTIEGGCDAPGVFSVVFDGEKRYLEWDGTPEEGQPDVWSSDEFEYAPGDGCSETVHLELSVTNGGDKDGVTLTVVGLGTVFANTMQAMRLKCGGKLYPTTWGDCSCIDYIPCELCLVPEIGPLAACCAGTPLPKKFSFTLEGYNGEYACFVGLFCSPSYEFPDLSVLDGTYTLDVVPPVLPATALESPTPGYGVVIKEVSYGSCGGNAKTLRLTARCRICVTKNGDDPVTVSAALDLWCDWIVGSTVRALFSSGSPGYEYSGTMPAGTTCRTPIVLTRQAVGNIGNSVVESGPGTPIPKEAAPATITIQAID